MNNKYYYLNPSTDLKEIGNDFPQIQKINSEYDRKAPDSYSNIEYHFFPDFIPNLYYFILNQKAKLTDVLSYIYFIPGLLISEKVKNIFESGFNLDSHRFYKATIKFKDKFYDNYFLLHVISDNFCYIDYRATKFFVTNTIGKIISPIDIKDANDFRKNISIEIKKNRFITTNGLFYNSNFYQRDIDLFILSEFNTKICISQKLRDHIILQKITGILMPESIIRHV